MLPSTRHCSEFMGYIPQPNKPPLWRSHHGGGHQVIKPQTALWPLWRAYTPNRGPPTQGCVSLFLDIRSGEGPVPARPLCSGRACTPVDTLCCLGVRKGCPVCDLGSRGQTQRGRSVSYVRCEEGERDGKRGKNRAVSVEVDVVPVEIWSR